MRAERSRLDTSLSLLERVKANQQDAWRDLVELYGPTVFEWCRRAGLSEEDACDVGQEVFKKVHKSIPGFSRDRVDGTFRGWLCKVTQHTVIDFRRKPPGPLSVGGTSFQQRVTAVVDQEASVDQNGSVADQDGLTTELARRALDLLDRHFSEQAVQAILGTVVEGKTPREVAAELGMTEAAVRQAKSRGLRRLRELLGDPFGADEPS